MKKRKNEAKTSSSTPADIDNKRPQKSEMVAAAAELASPGTRANSWARGGCSPRAIAPAAATGHCPVSAMAPFHQSSWVSLVDD